MVKPRTFITDAQWKKINYGKLVELAQDLVKAPQLVKYLDENPDTQKRLIRDLFPREGNDTQEH